MSRDTKKPEKSTACCDFSLKTPHIGGTDGAVRGEPNSLGLSRVVTEVDKVKFGRGGCLLVRSLRQRMNENKFSFRSFLCTKALDLWPLSTAWLHRNGYLTDEHIKHHPSSIFHR